MSKIRTAVAAVAVAGAALVAIPATAHADGGCNPGNFCAYSDDYGITYQNPNNSSDWPSSVKNVNDWVANNGIPGGRDHVNIYYNENNTGAYACIGYGTSWNLRGNSYYFNWTRNGDTSGQGRTVHDLAASHRWVYSCGNNTW